MTAAAPRPVDAQQFGDTVLDLACLIWNAVLSLILLLGTGYVVFVLDRSPWWWVAAVMALVCCQMQNDRKGIQ